MPIVGALNTSGLHVVNLNMSEARPAPSKRARHTLGASADGAGKAASDGAMHVLDNTTAVCERKKVLPVKLRPRVGSVTALQPQSPPRCPKPICVHGGEEMIVPRTRAAIGK